MDDKETRVQAAANAYLVKQYKSIAKAAQAFDVPESTVKYRVRGRQTRIQSHEHQQLLSEAEELELVRWITQLTAIGYAPGFSFVKEMAEELRRQRIRSINDGGIELVSYPPIDKKWITCFLKRHTQIKSIVSRAIDATRIKDVTKDALMKWFNDVHKVFDEYKIDLKNVYNMDETGFSIGKIQATRVIINAKIRAKYQAQPGRQEWVSVIECICADETSIPPLIIFRGENLSSTWIPANIHESWKFSCNTRGWTSNIHGLEWLIRCFEPATREKANGQPRVLICDGHRSHITVNFLQHCRENNIHLLILPPHSSHLTQPLDIAIFGPLKTAMTAELQHINQIEVLRIQKAEWLGAYVQAHSRAFSSSNILSAFSGAGINPFCPTKVIRRLPEIESSESSIDESEVNQPLSLDPTLIPSFPNDVSTLWSARQALSQHMSENPAFDTPVRNFVDRFGKCSEPVWARNSILETSNNALKGVIMDRKKHEDGVRAVLKGKHLVTAMEVLEEVKKAEEAAQKRKAKNPQKKKTRLNLIPSEEDTDSDDTIEPQDREIADCIVIQS